MVGGALAPHPPPPAHAALAPLREFDARPPPQASAGRGGPREGWERFAREAREGFLAELEGPAPDAARCLLALAAEHDAISTRAVVPLPQASFSGRVDKLVEGALREAAAAGGVDDPASVICACVDHLYGAARFRVAQADVEQASPYRTYMHNVLAQRQGTKEAVAAVLLSVLARAEARIGRPLEYRLEIPAEAAGRPTAVHAPGEAPEDLSRTTRALVLGCLRRLKRGYWPWAWVPGESSGFLVAAEAALESGDRFNQAMGFGVMQPEGRPFGNMQLAGLSCEALALLEGGHELRDSAVLLCHEKRVREAYEALKACVEAGGTVSPPLERGGLVGDMWGVDVGAGTGQALGEREHAAALRLAAHLEAQLAELAWQSTP